MRSLAITDSNFANQREAVKEERRLRVDNQPYAGALFEGVYALADSTGCFPYAHSIIGSMDDLNAAKTPDVKAFFDLYYAPNNATLTVVGDFDTPATKALIQQYFGDIPGPPRRPRSSAAPRSGPARSAKCGPTRKRVCPAWCWRTGCRSTGATTCR